MTQFPHRCRYKQLTRSNTKFVLNNNEITSPETHDHLFQKGEGNKAAVTRHFHGEPQKIKRAIKREESLLTFGDKNLQCFHNKTKGRDEKQKTHSS